jgi:hypothetical protein
MVEILLQLATIAYSQATAKTRTETHAIVGMTGVVLLLPTLLVSGSTAFGTTVARTPTLVFVMVFESRVA